MASKDITQSGTNSIKNNNQPSSEEINSNVNQNSNPQNNQTSQQKSPNLPIQEDTDSSLSPLDPEEILDNDEIFSQTKSKRKHIESFKNMSIQIPTFRNKNFGDLKIMTLNYLVDFNIQLFFDYYSSILFLKQLPDLNIKGFSGVSL